MKILTKKTFLENDEKFKKLKKNKIYRNKKENFIILDNIQFNSWIQKYKLSNSNIRFEYLPNFKLLKENEIIVDPYQCVIYGKNSKRKFIYKDKYIDEEEKFFLKTLVIFFKKENLFYLKKPTITITKIAIKNSNDTTIVLCENNIPNYWGNTSFQLFYSYGKISYSDDITVRKEFWKKNKNNLYEGYLLPKQYKNFSYEALDKIENFVCRKWSRSYQAVNDFYVNPKDLYIVEKIKFTVTSFIANTEYDNIQNYDFGSIIEDFNKDVYNREKIETILNNKFEKLKLKFKIPEKYSYVKLYLKEGNIKTNILKEKLQIENFSKFLSDYSDETIAGFYPVKIEFLNYNFEKISSIEFNKFGVGTFNNFLG